jgi:hypothetical protein
LPLADFDRSRDKGLIVDAFALTACSATHPSFVSCLLLLTKQLPEGACRDAPVVGPCPFVYCA